MNNYFPKITAKQAKKFGEIARQTYQKDIVKTTVVWFAKMMKIELEKHLDRPGWKKESCEYLGNRLFGEFQEMEEAIYQNKSKEEVIKECADIANFAMMIADIYEVSEETAG